MRECPEFLGILDSLNFVDLGGCPLTQQPKAIGQLYYNGCTFSLPYHLQKQKDDAEMASKGDADDLLDREPLETARTRCSTDPETPCSSADPETVETVTAGY